MASNHHGVFQVDGGLSCSTIHVAAEAGANCIVAGTAILGAPDPQGVMKEFREAVVKAQGQ